MKINKTHHNIKERNGFNLVVGEQAVGEGDERGHFVLRRFGGGRPHHRVCPAARPLHPRHLAAQQLRQSLGLVNRFFKKCPPPPPKISKTLMSVGSTDHDYETELEMK